MDFMGIIHVAAKTTQILHVELFAFLYMLHELLKLFLFNLLFQMIFDSVGESTSHVYGSLPSLVKELGIHYKKVLMKILGLVDTLLGQYCETRL